MVSQIKSLVVGVFASLAVALPAVAITWTFVDTAVLTNDVGNGQFEARITGTFDYDSDTDVMSNITLIVENSGLAGTPSFEQFDGTYTQQSLVPLGDTIFDIAIDGGILADGVFSIQLQFAAPLLNSTNPGEKIRLVKASIGACTTFSLVNGCDIDDAGGFGTNDGTNQGNQSLVGAVTPIPLPAALPLMIAGLAGIGFVARRRKSATA